MTLRVVVRNARMAFTRKRDALIGLRPDIAVIPECGRVIEATSYSSVWFGSIRNKGLAIFGFDTYQVSLEPGYDDSIKEVAPAWVVAGANRFFLLAVWSQRPYGEAIQRALVTYRAQLTDGPPLWPVTSIQILCSTKVGWSAITVELFNSCTLSACRALTTLRLGKPGIGDWDDALLEWTPGTRTIYHIDYCFLPKAWLGGLRSVSLGGRSDWGHLSDHIPLIVDVDIRSSSE